MKQIIIFGATGNIGLWATKFAIKNGLKVRVLLRDLATMPEELRLQVEILEGDVTKIDDVNKAVQGVDGVVVALGTRNNLGATTVLSEGMKNIIAAMQLAKVECVSVCLSAFLFYEPGLVPAIFNELNSDHQRMLDCLKASGLKWVAILPPHFTDEPRRPYKVQYDSSPGRTISKEDLGAFMVQSLTQPQHHNKLCGIANTD